MCESIGSSSPACFLMIPTCSYLIIDAKNGKRQDYIAFGLDLPTWTKGLVNSTIQLGLPRKRCTMEGRPRANRLATISTYKQLTRVGKGANELMCNGVSILIIIIILN